MKRVFFLKEGNLLLVLKKEVSEFEKAGNITMKALDTMMAFVDSYCPDQSVKNSILENLSERKGILSGEVAKAINEWVDKNGKGYSADLGNKFRK